jgi:hypothetical protein
MQEGIGHAVVLEDQRRPKIVSSCECYNLFKIHAMAVELGKIDALPV